MLTDRERSFASDLLRAAWTSDDAVIHVFIRKNKTHDPHPFEVFLSFFCVSQRGGVCDDCMEMPNFKRIQIQHVRKEKMWSVECKHEKQRACVCADELEYLPLDVLDTKTYHRISTNLKRGMCPHVFKFLKDLSLTLHKEFCQNMIEEWYETVDLDKRCLETCSLIYGTHHTHKSICRAAANLGSILFRLDRRQVLSHYSKKYSHKYGVFPYSSFYSYDFLALALITGRQDFCMDLLQQRKTRKQQLKELTIFDRTLWQESLLLDLVVEKNLRLFKAILKILEKKDNDRSWHCINMDTLFYVCMKACNVEFIKAFLNCDLKWTTNEWIPDFLWYRSRRESAFHECIRKGKEDIVYLVMGHPVFIFAVQHVLILAVIYGRIEMMEKVLQWYSKHGLHMAEFELDLYTLAVLHSMPQVIKLLDQYHVPETLTVKLSAVDFAKCLGYTECMEILSKTNHTCFGDTTDYSPLHEVQRLQENMQKPILIPVHLYMDALIRSGSCVNSEDPQGITPIQLTIQRGDYRSVRLLLMNGVNLFQGQTFLVEKGTTQLLLEIFYFNANIYNNLIQIIRSVVPESCDFGDDELVSRVFMYFIFHCVHSVSPKDEVHLNKTVPQNWFGVKSLQVSCRNVLRRHYGRCIHDFVQRFVKPKALKKFLLLIDHIEQLQDKLNLRYMKFNDSERY